MDLLRKAERSSIDLMNNDLLNEIIRELRKQNVKLDQIHLKQKELTWYLWFIAVILAVSIALPVALSTAGR